MNSSSKGVPTSKLTSLNPNAAEFVPLSLRSAFSTGTNSDAPKLETPESGGKAILNRTDSTTSNTSDDETHQYWRVRLPDDITPDFGEDFFKESQSFLSGNSAGLNYSSSSKPVNVMESGKLTYEQLDRVNGKSRFVFSEHGEGRSASGISASGAWDQQSVGHDQQFVKNRDGYFSVDESDMGFVNELVGEQAYTDNNDINPVELLAMEFPDFAAESLASIYYGSGGDLGLTMEMLTQLELQDDTGSQQSFSTKSSSAPNLMGMDFPALTSAEMLNGLSQYTEDDAKQSVNTYRRGVGDKLFFNGSGNSISATDFAAVVRKNASEHLGQWKYDRNSSVDVNLGSSRNSQVSSGSFAANNRAMNGDRVRGSTNVRQTPQLWLETGESVANMYSDLREEARDHARVRNTYFEQARQAYLIGNKALAKELSAKGQWHNGLMKAAHGKAGEAIYRQRNQVTSQLQNYLPGQERLIDLHGLHVNEAIHVLKSELNALRNTARSSGQRQQVLICVGTGHHTKGSRTPARLPIAIEKHLLEEEHLDYSEPQPGMLRVVVY